MILLVVWDGLRPDTIQKESTPFLWEMAARGVFCRASHCVFPTATRINSASLTTGCYPRRHGLVDNELFVPALDAAKPVSCADWRLLQAMAESEGGRLLETPTLGEMLRDAGRSMVSVGSGSPGTTYLTNPTITGPIVNWAVSWPEEIARDIDQRYGGPLPPGSTSAERTAYVLRALYEVLLPERRPDLATIWLTEPDHTQHYEGLGSGEALMVLRQLDDHLRELVEEAASYGPLTCFLLSDHGFSTVQRLSADPLDELRAEGLLPEGAMLVRASNSLYFNDVARERLEEVVSFLLTRSWLGALFVREDLRERVPYLLPQGAVMCGHRRSAELLFAFRWSDEANEKGIPGSVCNPSSLAGTHGSGSPYVLNNTLIAWGEGIKEGIVSEVPCGIVDVAPTALYLLGLRPPSSMDGRVLYELLRDGPDVAAVSVSRRVREAVYPLAEGGRRLRVRYSYVDGTEYLDEITLDMSQQRR